MATSQDTSVGGPSPRVRLAEVAAQAARSTPGVARLDAGPGGLFATVGGRVRVAGVTCASAPEGGFDVALRLVCELTELTGVADAVRAAVQAAGRQASLAVATVTILIADVVDPDAAVAEAEA